MEQKELTAATVAEVLGMTEGGLRHWLNGTRKPSIDQFLDLCAAISLDPAMALSNHMARIDRAKLSSPSVDRALSAKPQTNENHKKFMAKIRSFKTTSRRLKALR